VVQIYALNSQQLLNNFVLRASIVESCLLLKKFMFKLTLKNICLFSGFLFAANTALATTIFEKNYSGHFVEKFENGKLKYEITVKNGKKEGIETFYYENGAKKIETEYKNDKEDGVWKQWYESGQLKLEAHYKNGEEHGAFTQWYDNGQKRVESSFVNGKKDGVECAWERDGTKKYETTYKDGQEIKNGQEVKPAAK
jgi:MORN repeat variant